MVFALLAQEAAPAGLNPLELILPFALIFLVFYFLIHRPNQRERMKRENLLNALAKGDHVVTIGGLCGKVESIDKAAARVTLLVDKNVRLTFLKAAIDRIEDRKASKKEGEEKESS